MKRDDYVVKTIEKVSEDLKYQASNLLKQKSRHVADDLRWNEIVQVSFKKRIKTTFVLDSNGSVLGMCNWAESPKLLGHKTIVSGPFAGLGGMICLPEVEDILIDAMFSISVQHRSALVIRTEIHKRQKENLVYNELVFFEKRIASGNILLELNKKLRYEVRKSFKKEVTSHEIEEIAGTRELSDFYSQTFQALGTPFLGERYLKNLQEVYRKDLIFILLRDRSSRLIGAAVIVKIFDSFHVLHANTNVAGQDLSAGYRLYFEILMTSQRHGAGRVNFGRSIKGSSQASFKRKWAMEEVPVPFLRSTDSSQMFFYKKDVLQHNVFIWVWKHLPFWFVKLSGPILAKLII